MTAEYETIFNHAYNRVIDLCGETTTEEVQEYIGRSHGQFPEFAVAVAEGCAAAFAELSEKQDNG